MTPWTLAGLQFWITTTARLCPCMRVKCELPLVMIGSVCDVQSEMWIGYHQEHIHSEYKKEGPLPFCITFVCSWYHETATSS